METSENPEKRVKARKKRNFGNFPRGSLHKRVGNPSVKSEHLQHHTCSRFTVIQFHLELHIKKKIKKRKTDKSVEAPVSGHEIWY